LKSCQQKIVGGGYVLVRLLDVVNALKTAQVDYSYLPYSNRIIKD